MISLPYVEKKFGEIAARLDLEFVAQGKLLCNQANANSIIFDMLLDELLAEERYDDLIDWFTDQLPTGGGDEYFRKISKKLVSVGDSFRLYKLWRIVISNYKQMVENSVATGMDWNRGMQKAGYLPIEVERSKCDGYDLAINAFLELLKGLEELKETELINKVGRDLEFFKEGRKVKLAKADPRKIDETLFWEIIERAKHESESAIQRPEHLADLLSSFSASAIKKFATTFYEKLDESYSWDLWAIAYISFGGCSDDGFEYYRGWLISEGRRTFEAAKTAPESLVEITDQPIQLENMLMALRDAYELRAEKSLSINTRKRAPLKPIGKPWKEEDLPNRFPLTCKKFDFGT